MTFHARHQVDVLLDGVYIVRLEATERDGHAFSAARSTSTPSTSSPAKIQLSSIALGHYRAASDAKHTG
jgi:hypothetical protein